MSDFELVDSARKVLISLDNAICEYFAADEQKPYSPEASIAAFKEVKARAAHVRPFASTRLDVLTQRYIGAGQGDWQKPLLDDLQAIDLLCHPDRREKVWGKLRSRLTGLCYLCELVGNDSANDSDLSLQATLRTDPPSPTVAKCFLDGWTDILKALGLPDDSTHSNRNRVKYRNETYGGPIKPPGQGGKPRVEKIALIEWWNKTDDQIELEQLQDSDSIATTANRYKHGTEGIEVVPSIAGHVKKRRKAAKS